MDYSGLTKLNKKAYRLADVKDQIEKLAFDIVRFKDKDKGADLWQVQSADDGDYIVALYSEPDDDMVKEAAWQVSVSQNGQDLHIAYKGDPLLRLASSKLGIPPNELHQAEEYLPNKLASNKKLVKALLRELPEAARLETLKRYPELS